MALLEKINQLEMIYTVVKLYAYFLIVVCAAGIIGGVYNLFAL